MHKCKLHFGFVHTWSPWKTSYKVLEGETLLRSWHRLYIYIEDGGLTLYSITHHTSVLYILLFIWDCVWTLSSVDITQATHNRQQEEQARIGYNPDEVRFVLFVHSASQDIISTKVKYSPLGGIYFYYYQVPSSPAFFEFWAIFIAAQQTAAEMRLLVEMELLDEKKKKQKGGRLGWSLLFVWWPQTSLAIDGV